MNLISEITWNQRNNRPYIEDKYNQFFNPNVCHVCKAHSTNLITCNKCLMISYCSEEHEVMYKDSHLEICSAIVSVITAESFGFTYRNSEEWIESRKGIVQKIEDILSRYLHPYEMEMVLFPKSCLECHRQINIRECIVCHSVNYCDEHQVLLDAQHGNYCKELLVFLHMNIAYMKGDLMNTYASKLKCTTFSSKTCHYNTITFINNYAGRGNQFTLPEHILSTNLWVLQHFIHSDFVSGPLTLHYALHESNLLTLPSATCKYIVHIIGASRIDVAGISVWHLFLHLFRNIKNLYIVFIKSPISKSHELGYVCSRCSEYYQKIYIKSVSEPYHDYVRLESFEQPDVIVLFQRVSYMVNTWFESISTIIAQKCPLLLTAETEETVQKNANKIQEVTGTTRNRLYRENKFVSCMPYRSYVTGGLYYRNAHFIMYT